MCITLIDIAQSLPPDHIHNTRGTPHTVTQTTPENQTSRYLEHRDWSVGWAEAGERGIGASGEEVRKGREERF